MNFTEELTAYLHDAQRRVRETEKNRMVKMKQAREKKDANETSVLVVDSLEEQLVLQASRGRVQTERSKGEGGGEGGGGRGGGEGGGDRKPVQKDYAMMQLGKMFYNAKIKYPATNYDKLGS